MPKAAPKPPKSKAAGKAASGPHSKLAPRERRPRARKSSAVEPDDPSSAELNKLRKDGVNKHNRAANTRKKYDERVVAGQNWLSDMIGEHRAGAAPCDDILPPASDAGVDSDEPDPFDDPEVVHAFNAVPNKLSAKVLALYLTFKGFHEGLKTATVDGIRAVFKDFWGNGDDNQTYIGTWRLDPVSNKWVGNPVLSHVVKTLCNSHKNFCGQDDGNVRTHSVAMSKENMHQMFEYMDSLVPPSKYLDPKIVHGTSMRRLITSILLFKAFASTGWTIWSRNFELIKLRERDLVLDLVDLPSLGTPYFELHLINRKGWQHKDPDLRGGIFKISNQPDLPACNAYYWLLEWRQYLEKVILGRSLEPDDYIFPAIGANGVVQVGEHVEHAEVQKLITQWTTGAKLAVGHGKFTTHCFRRGGAQYRFMFAPVGKRWTLRQRDTLIKYLLDELQSYEEDCSTLLFPSHPDQTKSFLGEATSVGPATFDHVQNSTQSIHVRFDRLEHATERLLNMQYPPATHHVPLPAGYCPPFSHPYFLPPPPPLLQHQQQIPQWPPQAQPAMQWPRPSTQPMRAATRTRSPTRTPSPVLPPPQHMGQGPFVPDIPVMLADGSKSHDADSWRIVVRHWRDGDPAHGLHTPLKDWPPEWLKTRYRRNAQKYGNRKWIALEFLKVHDGDEESFLTAFPEAEVGLQKLLDAVNAAREGRGERKKRGKL
uniref:Tyr recombinase domain-containing protein n=1 Tax=Mycena chlorophos TaxID=658473 RepID=A0ABQ0L606_MYCCL|nr:predicted protein [Mycena chlorophos]